MVITKFIIIAIAAAVLTNTTPAPSSLHISNGQCLCVWQPNFIRRIETAVASSV
jgi:hypothetical protein